MPGSLSIKNIAVGMEFKALSPVERSDGIESPEGHIFAWPRLIVLDRSTVYSDVLEKHNV